MGITWNNIITKFQSHEFKFDVNKSTYDLIVKELEDHNLPKLVEIEKDLEYNFHYSGYFIKIMIIQ